MDRRMREAYAQRVREVFNEQVRSSGMTQEKLGEQSGVPLRTLNGLLRGESVPNDPTLLPIMRALGIAPTPDQVRESWAEPVRTFLDVMGVFLSRVDPVERRQIMHEIAERIAKSWGKTPNVE